MSKQAMQLQLALEKTVDNVLSRHDVPVPQEEVAQVTDKVINAIAKQPVVQHLTNNEPWYKSRVTLGAMMAALSGILGLLGHSFPAEVQGQIIDFVIAALPLVGGLFALYGRWVAKKPLGEKV